MKKKTWIIEGWVPAGESLAHTAGYLSELPPCNTLTLEDLKLTGMCYTSKRRLASDSGEPADKAVRRRVTIIVEDVEDGVNT